MLKKPLIPVVVTLLVVVAVSAIAQNLLVETPGSLMQQPMPSRGMTMEYVESQFGSPAGRRAAVGDPPITRWEYQQFIVYFEYKRVIHSVAKRNLN